MQEVRAAVIGTGVMGRKYAQMIAEGKAGALRPAGSVGADVQYLRHRQSVHGHI